MRRVLILGGTAEARRLADALSAREVSLVYSLAGLTRDPAPVPGELRQGGFGGLDGLVGFLCARRIDAIVNATHPYAARMTANAETAGRRAACPVLHLRRQAWTQQVGEHWERHPDIETALRSLPAGARAFLATGAGTREALSQDLRAEFVLRSIEPVAGLPPNVTNLVARPPFAVEDEQALFRTERITHLVTRNSGGEGGRSRLEAAAMLGLPSLVIDRPALANGATVAVTVGEALSLLTGILALDTRSDPAS